MLLKSITLLGCVFSAMGMGVISSDCEEGTPSCPAGWKLFKRKNGAWCLKVFTGNVTWWEAERECRCKANATLSGIESINEQRYVEEKSQAYFDKVNIKNGAFWIGAYRRKQCEGKTKNWKKNSLCTEEKMFQFTDKHTCGVYPFKKWATNEPSSSIHKGKQENCVNILISTDSNKKYSDLSGTYSDKECSDIDGSGSIHLTKGFVCGRPASLMINDNSKQTMLMGAGKPKNL